MAVAIKTKFLGATNCRGSRVKASVMYNWGDGSRHSVTLDWDHSKDAEGNHTAAAEALAYLTGTLIAIINGHKQAGIGDLLPWHLKATL